MSRDELLAYYAQHGPMTDPGSYAGLFDALPADPAALCDVVQGIMAVDMWTTLGVLQVSDERRAEANVRGVREKLRRIMALDDHPLAVERPMERRLLGNCRNLSLMLCAMLRHHGIPARIRVGFDAMDPQHHRDHWVCQYWWAAEERWVMADMWMYGFYRDMHLLPPPAQEALAAIEMDPLDLRSDQFITGGQAWQRCRAGEDATHYGIEGDLWGLWFVRDNMQRDMVALNKVEVLPWDNWGCVSGSQDNPVGEELERLDRMAALTVDADAAFGDMRALYEATPALHPPAAWAES
jgi:hypothetical protein